VSRLSQLVTELFSIWKQIPRTGSNRSQQYIESVYQ
jgi:hypothetical protein